MRVVTWPHPEVVSDWSTLIFVFPMPENHWNDFSVKNKFSMFLWPRKWRGVTWPPWDGLRLIYTHIRVPHALKTTRNDISAKNNFRCFFDPGSGGGSHDSTRKWSQTDSHSYPCSPPQKTIMEGFSRKIWLWCSFDLCKQTDRQTHTQTFFYPQTWNRKQIKMKLMKLDFWSI